MLTQEIGHIKTELYMLSKGPAGASLPVMGHAQPKSTRASQHRENQAYIKCLEEKLKSLESLYKMYEHQRDDASRDFHRLKEEINKILKDVAYKQENRSKEHGESYQKKISGSIKRHEKTTLPPLKGPLCNSNKSSYLKLHEVKSASSKLAENEKHYQSKKRDRKLPPISDTKGYAKGENLYSDKPRRSQVVQKKWANTTRKDVLPPLEKLYSKKETDMSKFQGKEQAKVKRDQLIDPKLPSMRMKRIAGLQSGNESVPLPATKKGKVQGGFKEIKKGSHKDYVCHVDDQRPGSTDNNDDYHKDASTRFIKHRSRENTMRRNKENGMIDEMGADTAGYEDNEHLHLDNVSPTLKSRRQRLKSAVARPRIRRKVENDDFGRDSTSPCQQEVYLSTQEIKKDEDIREIMMQTNTEMSVTENVMEGTSNVGGNVSVDQDVFVTGARRSNEDEKMDTITSVTTSRLSNVDEWVHVCKDNPDIEARQNFSEQNSAENRTRSPKSKRKSVTINDKTTVHSP
ncbi:uncharacterized protein PF3D7_1120000-like [Argopecten irradians]|uniref:uncharacterized protein PF3D7_1120000-like n=1 Tax=Argopecten irradians TaxID=31199 RepID=UPI003710A042